MTDQKSKATAKIVDTKRVFDGFFKMDELTIQMTKHEGGEQEIKRLVFERGHAVGILGYDPARDEVLLISEMRPGILATGDDPYADSIPAGMIDKGETALQAATREMVEETGMTLKDSFLIHAGAYVSPGGTSEKIALVGAILDMSKAGGVHGHASEGEDIKSNVVSSDEFIARAENGKLVDMKSLVCAFWLAKNRDRLKEQYAPKKPDAKASGLKAG